MHRIILNTPKGMWSDHINHNTLDNRRKNLRIATGSQNQWNKRKASGSSKYKGVSWHKGNNKWASQLLAKEKPRYHKEFNSEIDAALAYDVMARKYFGAFACLNFPKTGEQSCFI